MQRVIKRCIHEKVNLEAYDRNRNLLYSSLCEYGFSCIKPQGAFYLFMKSPVENEKEFCEVCKKYNILDLFRAVPLHALVMSDRLLCFL